MLAGAGRSIVFGQAKAVLTLLDAGLRMEPRANATVCIEHAVALQEPALAAVRGNDDLEALVEQLGIDATVRRTPTRFARSDVPHRPVNTRPQGRLRQRRVRDPTLGQGSVYAAGLMITVWPRRSSWATSRRVCAWSLRRRCQSAPRSW